MENSTTSTVAGAAYLQYFPQPITWPSLAATEMPTTLADAPMGVALPPISVPMDSDEATVVAAALADPKVQKFTEGKNLVKTILVPNKLVNLIAK